MDARRIVIIGAGPCGLACARELDRLGHRDWLILERDGHAGGLASSVVDPAGFTWDLGGHVVFSHFGEFDALLDEMMGDEILATIVPHTCGSTTAGCRTRFRTTSATCPRTWSTECLEGLARRSGRQP